MSLLFLFLVFSIEQLVSGQSHCETPEGENGECIPLTRCPQLEFLQHSYLLESYRCRSRIRRHVCCPLNSNPQISGFDQFFDNIFHSNIFPFTHTQGDHDNFHSPHQNFHGNHNSQQQQQAGFHGNQNSRPGGNHTHRQQNHNNKPSFQGNQNSQQQQLGFHGNQNSRPGGNHNNFNSHQQQNHNNKPSFQGNQNSDNFNSHQQQNHNNKPSSQGNQNTNQGRRPQHKNFNLLPKECGFKEIGDDKIVGGQKADLNEFPWMALLAYDSGGGTRAFQCGGSIVNERYVVTAAHCLVGQLKERFIGVRVGEHDLRSNQDCITINKQKMCSPPVQDLRSEQVILHPGFNKKKVNENDIALVRVQPINLKRENAMPICLPLGEPLNRVFTNKLTVTGWGITEKKTKSQVLLKVDIPVVPIDKCTQFYPNKGISDKQICAGGEIGKDSCNGDSGGPLQSLDTVSGQKRVVLHGIVSYGPSNCGQSTAPGVYTRVAAYVDWILDNMRK